MMDLVGSVEQQQLREEGELPQLRAGDLVRVHALIFEGGKERTQIFQGTVMRVRKGGANASFTVRRIAAHGVGVERTFLFHSPRLWLLCRRVFDPADPWVTQAAGLLL
jgi:large subunit ribosomal protein L19